jgi:hypothetical protein
MSDVKEREPKAKTGYEVPTVGRIVHFKSSMGGETGNGRPFAPALVTWVYENGRVNLMVFRDGENIIPFPNVQHVSEGGTRGWYWPERV